MTTQTLGERIRAARQAAGLSQEKLAERLGLTRQAVTKWETGQSAPSTENLLRLAEVLGVPVTALLGEEASSPPLAGQPLRIPVLSRVYPSALGQPARSAHHPRRLGAGVSGWAADMRQSA